MDLIKAKRDSRKNKLLRVVHLNNFEFYKLCVRWKEEYRKKQDMNFILNLLHIATAKTGAHHKKKRREKLFPMVFDLIVS